MTLNICLIVLHIVYLAVVAQQLKLEISAPKKGGRIVVAIRWGNESGPATTTKIVRWSCPN